MERKIQKKLGVALVVGALLSAGGTVLAQPDAGEREGRRAKLLERFDVNKDGKLDETEREAARAEKKAMREEHRKQKLTQFDANRDGKLDDTERKAMREQRVAETFKKIDANGDGMISLSEFQAAPFPHGGKGKFHGRRGH